MIKFNTVLSLIIMIISLWGFMAAVLLSNMEPLTASVKGIKTNILIISLILFFLASGILLVEFFRFSNVNAIDIVLTAASYFIVSFVVAWILFSIFIYIMQDNLLFSPGNIKPSRLIEARTRQDIEEINIKTSDNTINSIDYSRVRRATSSLLRFGKSTGLPLYCRVT